MFLVVVAHAKCRFTKVYHKKIHFAKVLYVFSITNFSSNSCFEDFFFLFQVLVNKLDQNKSTMSVEEKKLLMETIKSLQGAIETTRSQIVGSDQPKSKKQVDREVLDTELELYTVQAEGGDITRLRNRLKQLKAQQVAAGVTPRTVRSSPYSLERLVDGIDIFCNNREVFPSILYS